MYIANINYLPFFPPFCMSDDFKDALVGFRQNDN